MTEYEPLFAPVVFVILAAFALALNRPISEYLNENQGLPSRYKVSFAIIRFWLYIWGGVVLYFAAQGFVGYAGSPQ